MSLLRVENLRTYFDTRSGVMKAVDGINLDVREGSTCRLPAASQRGRPVRLNDLAVSRALFSRRSPSPGSATLPLIHSVPDTLASSRRLRVFYDYLVTEPERTDNADGYCWSRAHLDCDRARRSLSIRRTAIGREASSWRPRSSAVCLVCRKIG